jgi:hypothetical protein
MNEHGFRERSQPSSGPDWLSSPIHKPWSSTGVGQAASVYAQHEMTSSAVAAMTAEGGEAGHHSITWRKLIDRVAYLVDNSHCLVTQQNRNLSLKGPIDLMQIGMTEPCIFDTNPDFLRFWIINGELLQLQLPRS